METLNKLSIPKMQSYAADCIMLYCKEFGISDKSIDYLVLHLKNMQKFSNLPLWEQEGSKLELTGRGDPLPISLENKINPQRKYEFLQLIENAVEVGIIGLYGDPDPKPYYFLSKCISILQKNDIDLPQFS